LVSRENQQCLPRDFVEKVYEDASIYLQSKKYNFQWYPVLSHLPISNAETKILTLPTSEAQFLSSDQSPPHHPKTPAWLHGINHPQLSSRPKKKLCCTSHFSRLIRSQ